MAKRSKTPSGPMRIIVNPDQTVSMENARGLTGIMGCSTVDQVNALGSREIAAVLVCVRVNAFPLGGGEGIYRDVLASLRPEIVEKAAALPLGDLRRSLAARAAKGCNAPHDSYLRIAYDIATGAEYIHRY